jgi:hypothetical protein
LKAELLRNLDPKRANSPEQIKADQALFLETIKNCCMAPAENGWKLAARRWIEPISVTAWSKRPEEREAARLMYNWIRRFTDIQMISEESSAVKQTYAFVERDVTEYPYIKDAILSVFTKQDRQSFDLNKEIKKINDQKNNAYIRFLYSEDGLVSKQFSVIFRKKNYDMDFVDQSQIWRMMFSTMGSNQGPGSGLAVKHGLYNSDDLPNIRPNLMNFHILSAIYKLNIKSTYSDAKLIEIYESMSHVKAMRRDGVSPLQPVF